MIVASHYDWLDMRTTGGVGASYGVPFDHVQMYWAVVTDPAVGSGVFHNDWNNVDYIMADSDMIVDANNFHMKLLLSALQHAIPIKTFQNRLYWVTIYQVQHRHSPAGMGGQSSGPEMPLPIVNNGPTTLYFAEGYTGRRGSKGGTTVDESLAVHNANPFPATVTITYLFEHGSPLAVTRTILPDTTLHESVNADIGPDKAAAAIVSSAAHLTAERIMRRVDAPGPSVVAGNAGLDQAFYFATGDTGPTVQEYLAVANPGSSDAHVRVTFVEAESSTPGSSETFTVPANGRATWNIRSDLRAMAAKPAGLIVTSDQPIVVERVRYVSATAVQTATAVAHQTATAVAQQTATAVAHQRAIAVAHQRATAVAYQRAIADAYQRAIAVAHQQATAVAQQTATAAAHQTATAAAQQTATATAHQAATAVAQQTATATAHQTATAVAAHQTATVVAQQTATATAHQTATAVAQQTATAAAQQIATATAH
jgi:hypothetical protein